MLAHNIDTLIGLDRPSHLRCRRLSEKAPPEKDDPPSMVQQHYNRRPHSRREHYGPRPMGHERQASSLRHPHVGRLDGPRATPDSTAPVAEQGIDTTTLIASKRRSLVNSLRAVGLFELC